jgi:hypothetical protein
VVHLKQKFATPKAWERGSARIIVAQLEEFECARFGTGSCESGVLSGCFKHALERHPQAESALASPAMEEFVSQMSRRCGKSWTEGHPRAYFGMLAQEASDAQIAALASPALLSMITRGMESCSLTEFGLKAYMRALKKHVEEKRLGPAEAAGIALDSGPMARAGEAIALLNEIDGVRCYGIGFSNPKNETLEAFGAAIEAHGLARNPLASKRMLKFFASAARHSGEYREGGSFNKDGRLHATFEDRERIDDEIRDGVQTYIEFLASAPKGLFEACTSPRAVGALERLLFAPRTREKTLEWRGSYPTIIRGVSGAGVRAYLRALEEWHLDETELRRMTEPENVDIAARFLRHAR